jgi:hypothetical protein
MLFAVRKIRDAWVDVWDNVSHSIRVKLTGSEVTITYPARSPKSGQQTVATAGTRVALGSSQVYEELYVVAKELNGGNIFLGDVMVSSLIGQILPPNGISPPMHNVNIADVYIDASVSGDGVSWLGTIKKE